MTEKIIYPHLYSKFVVNGKLYGTNKKFRLVYSSDAARWAFGINLWNGRIWGYRKDSGKRELLKSVVN